MILENWYTVGVEISNAYLKERRAPPTPGASSG
jgi:hypothetical protein